MTAKHIAIVLIGCATAVCGAWFAVHAPAAATSPAPILIITLGGQVAIGALAHAGTRVASWRPPSSEHTPTGFAGRD